MPQVSNNNARVDQVIAVARAQIGKPYVWATAGPNTFDCSGLVYYAFKVGGGYKFNGRPTTYTLVGMGTAVNKDQIQPGDLVFPDAGHVQIYTGGGMIIEAPHTGANVREVPEWGKYWKIRRLIPNGITDGGAPVSGTDPSVGNDGGSESDSALAALDSALSSATDVNHWIRILYIILGIVLCLIALGRMGGSDVINEIGKVTK